MITFLVFFLIFILLIFVLISLFVIADIDVDDGVVGASFSVSFLISIISFLIYTTVSTQNDFNKCLELNKPIKSKVVYLSDSTAKIFKYSFEKVDREIVVKNTEPYFFVPESLIVVEPCSGKLILRDLQ